MINRFDYMTASDWFILLLMTLVAFPILWDIWLELNRGVTLRAYLGWW